MLKLATVIGGMAFGLFVGLLLIVTILRVIFNFTFHLGGSGPEWVGWLIFPDRCYNNCGKLPHFSWLDKLLFEKRRVY
jgi:hypothetical protein